MEGIIFLRIPWPYTIPISPNIIGNNIGGFVETIIEENKSIDRYMDWKYGSNSREQAIILLMAHV